MSESKSPRKSVVVVVGAGSIGQPVGPLAPKE
jgi:threonine dehydrogenase-like Zn-dependent dehydrogenase